MLTEDIQQFIELIAQNKSPKETYLQAIDADTSAALACSCGVQLVAEFTYEIESLKRGDKTMEELCLEYEEAYGANYMKILPHHRHFIELVSMGMPNNQAYRRAISDAGNVRTHITEGSVLSKKYKFEIARLRRRRARTEEEKYKEQAQENATRQIIAEDEMKGRLCALITGEKGLGNKPDESASHGEVLRGMELYFKVMGSFDRTAQKAITKTKVYTQQPPDAGTGDKS